MPGEITKSFSKKGATVINGNHTDIVSIDYEDKSMVVITQYQKIGTLVYIMKDGAPIDNRRPGFTTKILLGDDKPVTHVIARNLASTIYSGKPIVLGIALKDDSPAVMKTLQEVLKDYRH